MHHASCCAPGSAALAAPCRPLQASAGARQACFARCQQHCALEGGHLGSLRQVLHLATHPLQGPCPCTDTHAVHTTDNTHTDNTQSCALQGSRLSVLWQALHPSTAPESRVPPSEDAHLRAAICDSCGRCCTSPATHCRASAAACRPSSWSAGVWTSPRADACTSAVLSAAPGSAGKPGKQLRLRVCMLVTGVSR